MVDIKELNNQEMNITNCSNTINPQVKEFYIISNCITNQILLRQDKIILNNEITLHSIQKELIRFLINNREEQEKESSFIKEDFYSKLKLNKNIDILIIDESFKTSISLLNNSDDNDKNQSYTIIKNTLFNYKEEEFYSFDKKYIKDLNIHNHIEHFKIREELKFKIEKELYKLIDIEYLCDSKDNSKDYEMSDNPMLIDSLLKLIFKFKKRIERFALETNLIKINVDDNNEDKSQENNDNLSASYLKTLHTNISGVYVNCFYNQYIELIKSGYYINSNLSNNTEDTNNIVFLFNVLLNNTKIVNDSGKDGTNKISNNSANSKIEDENKLKNNISETELNKSTTISAINNIYYSLIFEDAIIPNPNLLSLSYISSLKIENEGESKKIYNLNKNTILLF